MPRPKKVDRPQSLHLRLPESLVSEVMALLFSELEGRVPHGKLSEYVSTLISADLKRRREKKAAEEDHVKAMQRNMVTTKPYGYGLDGGYESTCTCGWTMRFSNADDTQSTTMRRIISAHLNECNAKFY